MDVHLVRFFLFNEKISAPKGFSFNPQWLRLGFYCFYGLCSLYQVVKCDRLNFYST